MTDLDPSHLEPPGSSLGPPPHFEHPLEVDYVNDSECANQIASLCRTLPNKLQALECVAKLTAPLHRLRGDKQTAVEVENILNRDDWD